MLAQALSASKCSAQGRDAVSSFLRVVADDGEAAVDKFRCSLAA